MHLTHRETCRVCGSSALTKVIDLGEQHLQGSFYKPGKEIPPLRRIPTTLVRCDPMRDERACGLLQMLTTVPPEILYSAYWYRSGTNQTMRDHLRQIVAAACSLLNKEQAKVLDIGCNDGTLLGYYPEHWDKYGVDPSDVSLNIAKNIHVVQDMFPSVELVDRLQGATFDIITSIAMFYDLEDPIAFTKGVKQILAPNGIWIFEMSYMPSMLKLNSYDTICHEHIEYYSLAVIEYILRKTDMKLFNVELNTSNGGSIRCSATHIDNFSYKRTDFETAIRILRQQEFDYELDTDKPYSKFQERISAHRESLNSLLRQLHREGKRIHLYGASTKGNTILQWCEIDHRIIEVAAERNPDKYNAMTLGTDIPIVSEAESRAMKPDYYLVLPWHFREEFLVRERETLAQGVSFIFPLPSIEIVREGLNGQLITLLSVDGVLGKPLEEKYAGV